MPIAVADFERALDALARLRETEAVRLLVGPTEGFDMIRFELPGDHPEVKEVLTKHAFSLDALEEAVDDVAEVLSAVVRGVPEARFAASRAGDRRPEDEREPEDAARRKYRLVTQGFEMTDLKKRAWIKGTSKFDVLTSLAWEVGVKHQDAGRAPPDEQPVPFATLKLSSGPADHDILFSLARQGAHHVTLTLDREDIASMRDQLKRLDEEMERLSTANE